MKLPEVAARLREIAYELDLQELLDLADEIARRPATKGPRVSAPCTEAMREEMRQYKRSFPSAKRCDIADLFNVNTGRVSEALRGFRT